MKKIFLLLLLPVLSFSQGSWQPLYFPSPVDAKFIGEIDGKLFVNNDGAYISTDHENFTKVNDNIFFSAIVKYHNKYIGVFGTSIQESPDGYHWTVLNSSTNLYYGRTLVNFNDTLYFGSDKQVFRSLNGGVTWNIFIHANGWVNKIIEHKNRIYAMISDSLYSNSKNGNDQRVDLSSHIYSIESSDSVLVTASDTTILVSGNAGISWITLASTNNQHINNIIKTDTGFVYGGYNDIYTSDLNATNWQHLRTLDFSCFSLDIASNKMYAVKRMSFLLSNDAGITWQPLYKGLLNSENFNQVIPHNDVVFFKGWDQLFKSIDGIHTSEVPVGEFEFYDDIYSVYDLLLVHTNIGWRVSKDNGVTWNIFPTPDYSISNFFPFKGKIFGKTNNQIFYTDTASYNWQPLNIPPGGYPYKAAVSDSAIYILGNLPNGEVELHSSFDEGVTWKTYPAPNNGWIFFINGKLYLISADDNSTIYTENNGASWSSNFPGLPKTPSIWTNIPNNRLLSIIEHNDDLYCTIYFINSQNSWQGGVYRLPNGDTLWQEFNSGIENYLDYSGYYGAPQRLFSFQENLYLTIGDRGIWHYPNNNPPLLIDNNTQMKKGLSIYPNPANDKLSITIPQQLKSGKVRVYNSLGSLVIENKIINSSEKYEVDLTKLRSGIYSIEILNKDKIYREKFIVAK